jgi:ATP-dependent Clp protease ATP-binding subunit ClpA
MGLFDRFTQRGRAAITQSAAEARRLNHPSVGPEHIFLGMIGQAEGVAGWVLAELGVTLDVAREKVESLAGRGERTMRGEIPFSPEGKRVLTLALDEARRLGHNYIGTEHLLLALFQLDDTPGGVPIANVMMEFRLNAESVRALIMRELSQPQRQRSTHARLPLGPLGAGLLPQMGGARSNVVMCRVNDPDLEAIDTLIEAGVRATRSDAAAWLIHAGIEGNKSLFERLEATVREIRRLREQAHTITQEVVSDESRPTEPGAPSPGEGDERPSGGETRAGA